MCCWWKVETWPQAFASYCTEVGGQSIDRVGVQMTDSVRWPMMAISFSTISLIMVNLPFNQTCFHGNTLQGLKPDIWFFNIQTHFAQKIAFRGTPLLHTRNKWKEKARRLHRKILRWPPFFVVLTLKLAAGGARWAPLGFSSLKFLPLYQLPNAFAQPFLDNEDIFWH